MKKVQLAVLPLAFLTLIGCSETKKEDQVEGRVEAESFISASNEQEKMDVIGLNEGDWLGYEVDVKTTGRYKISIKTTEEANGQIWLEDYINNTDDRTYDITGKLTPADGMASVDGSPLQAGKHEIKLHCTGSLGVDWFQLELISEHVNTPGVLEQDMSGTEWSLVWSDEFDGEGLPDSEKWAYNAGNWGWGNNEPQYYTDARVENARLENGTLIIEARKNDMGQPWTSARLTTQGKQSFLYGKIEFRAKVPTGRGTWAAGWLLGDDYSDEISWPYCGEIDVLECVGYEIDDSTGAGINHATCHTRAYYFKQGNQIGSDIELDSMHTKYHTYGVEWDTNEIRGTLDGEHYFTYDKNADELEWPFDKPQNIIVNLAVGGGWGGAQGIDETWDSHEFILDYVRVYERK